MIQTGVRLYGNTATSLFREGLRRSFAMPNPFVLTNKICLNQVCKTLLGCSIKPRPQLQAKKESLRRSCNPHSNKQ